MGLLVWKDWAKDATLTDASFGTNVINSIDMNNVKTRQLGKVGRWQFGAESPDTQGVRIDFDFGADKTVNFLAVLGHNLAAANTVELDLGTTSGGSDVLNGTAQTIWTPGSNDANVWFYPLGSSYTARYARVTIAAFSNETIDIGRIWIGESWTINCSMDFSIGIMDRGTRSKSRAGSVWASDRQKLKRIQCRCWGLNDADFFGTSSDFDSFLEMDQVVGETGEVIIIPRNDSEHERHRMGCYGTVVQNGATRVRDRGANGLATEKTFVVEEDR